LKLVAIDRVRAGRRDQLDIQPPVATRKHRQIRKDAVLALCWLDFAPQCAEYYNSESEYRMNGSLHSCFPLETNTDDQKITMDGGRQCYMHDQMAAIGLVLRRLH
jgi:hypothetical protein